MIAANKRYGRLTAIAFSHRDKSHKSHWLFRCECGQKAVADAYNVSSGHTLSCGCLTREKTIARNKASAIHGLADTREYWAWRSMIRRCNDPKNNRYHLYGARGIKVCKRWLYFEYFLADMGRRPPQRVSG